ncbi:MAG: NAD-dependent epimerase/dehydratase family protein [Patescibacteria group bacterium]
MPKYKTALITGGAGFIGSHLCDALIGRHIKVVVVDDLCTGRRENVNPNAKFVKLSLTNPQFPLLIKRVKPDVVFHLAAQINVRESVNDPQKDAKTNIMGSLALLQACTESNVKKIIFSSSGGVMYPTNKRPPYQEKQTTDPISPYGISKRSTEMYLEFFYQTFGLPYVALRYANVYGPRQNPKGEAGVISIFAKNMLDGKPVVINGNGKQTRDFIYVSDVVRANIVAMQRNATGIFNIGTGRQTDVNVLFKKIKAMTGSDIVKRYGPAAIGEVMQSALDCRRATNILGWKPGVKLEDGLKKTIAWFAGK